MAENAADESEIMTHLSVIIPVYNAEAFVKQNVQKVLAELATQSFAWEVIAVDDGSRDRSLLFLQELAKENPELRVVESKCNRGKGHAVRLGIEHAQGHYVVFNDVDLAYPVSEIFRLLAVLEKGTDIAIACRVLPESRYEISPAFFRYLYTRHVMGRFFNLLVRKLLLPGLLDTQAGLKGFRAEVAKTVFARQTLFRFSFDVEILYIAQKFGFKIEQVPIFFRYFFEETTVRFFEDTVKMVSDLCRIKLNDWRGRYSATTPCKCR